MTEYDHQSFDDILTDLKDERNRTKEFKNGIEAHIRNLNSNSYWVNSVPSTFRGMISYSLKHFETSINELDDIHSDIQREVKDHHVKRLNKISEIAQKINVDIGQIWNREYDTKEYGDINFSVVEKVYGDTRDMAVNLLDISNIAARLNDFIGKVNPKMTKNNPWISGSFYLTIIIIILSLLATISKVVSWVAFPVIVIACILIVGVIGALQLKNDDRISDKTFLSLMIESYKRLPFVRNQNNKSK